eukprot:TRINITY_DN13728_c0_g1_i3.p1 TRINITY_DN13728_c0_g1~~TRINITY_DN13728_c0_g1_i3.p1  ORF type:complete len:488 (+),score=87.49 TRINITY_DN13728_c0_g1_i3:100-1563(+)
MINDGANSSQRVQSNHRKGSAGRLSLWIKQQGVNRPRSKGSCMEVLDDEDLIYEEVQTALKNIRKHIERTWEEYPNGIDDSYTREGNAESDHFEHIKACEENTERVVTTKNLNAIARKDERIQLIIDNDSCSINVVFKDKAQLHSRSKSSSKTVVNAIKKAAKQELCYDNFSTEFIAKPESKDEREVLVKKRELSKRYDKKKTRSILILTGKETAKNKEKQSDTEKLKSLLCKSCKTRIAPQVEKVATRISLFNRLDKPTKEVDIAKGKADDSFPLIAKQRSNVVKDNIRTNCFSELGYNKATPSKSNSKHKTSFKSLCKKGHAKDANSTPLNKLISQYNKTPSLKRNPFLNSSINLTRNTGLTDSAIASQGRSNLEAILNKMHLKKNRSKALLSTSKSRYYHKQRLMHTSYNVEANREIDWAYSQLYSAALRGDISFNTEQSAACYCEEEVDEALANASALDLQSVHLSFRTVSYTHLTLPTICSV